MQAPRLILLAAVILSCGCHSPLRGNFKITLKDGRVFLCKGEPRFISKTGYYRYHTYQNRESLLRADEVLMIEDIGS